MFTDEDTAYALALAEEERDTCPACGMPKSWCRDARKGFANQGRAKFEVVEDTCWATYTIAARQEAQDVPTVQKRATQTYVRFREGFEPAPDAGLDLADVEAVQGPLITGQFDVAGPVAADLGAEAVL